MTVTSIAPITDHIQQAIARLPQRFKDAVRQYSLTGVPDNLSAWEVFLYATVQNAQDFEDICGEMLAGRSLTTAQGVNLDRLGEIVGVNRQGRSDADYLAAIYVGIARNYSEATPKDIQSIWKLIIVAEDIQYIENYPAKFQLYLKIPTVANYPNIVDVTNAAKAVGVGFLPILVSPLIPIFGFEEDTDPDVAGFGVIKETAATSYDDYLFPANGAITDTARIVLSSSITGPDTDYILTFHLDTTQGPLFEAELTTEMAIDGGKIRFRDQAGHLFEFISDSTAIVASQTVGDSYRVSLTFIDDDLTLGSFTYGGMSRSPLDLLALFQNYGESDEATFNAENPDGLVKTTELEYDVETVSYYSSYVFPANYPGGGFTRVFSANRFGFPSRYELRVIEYLGEDTTNFAAELVGVETFSIVDAAGVLWQYVGGLTITQEDLFDFPDVVATDFRLELATSGGGDQLGQVFKDGVLTDYDDFFFNFSTISKTNEVTYDANNPNGFGKSVTANTAIGGGYYSLLVT